MQARAVPVRRAATLPVTPTAWAAGAFILIVGALLIRREFNIGAFWFIGIAFGVILQRSRLCFAGAFRDLIMAGDARIMRAILLGLGVATAGFGLLMARFVPDPSFGQLPPGAHIQTVGFTTVVGGLLFGVGMVLAGGCVSGTLWRMGEGYLTSWAAMAGILIGLYTANRTWTWWWDHDVSHRKAIWLPAEIGMGPAIVLTFAVLALLYVAALWWESRTPRMPAPASPARPPAFGVRETLARGWATIFSGHGWSYTAGAVALAVLGVFAYNLQAPLGVTGGLSLWADRVASTWGAGALPLKGSDLLAGCTPGNVETWFTIRTTTMSGLMIGAFLASVLSGEFKVRRTRQIGRYPQAFGGGLLMGYASVLAVGCTVGAFFSSVPSLAVSGWVFGAALFAGAWIGVVLIRRLPS